MIKKTFIAGATAVAMLIGFSVGSSQVLAETQAKADAMDKVTVVERRVSKIERLPSGMSKVRAAKRNARVQFDDLDLKRTADVRHLEDRINEAANSLCRQLKDDLPFGGPRVPVCVARTVSGAMAQVQQATEYAIASAR